MLLRATNLSCIRDQRVIFAGVDLDCRESELLLIEGENGAGKSSLLQILAGLSEPQTGDVSWRTESIFSSPTEYRAELHYIGHQHGIRLGLSVLENILLFGMLNDHVLTTTQIEYTLAKWRLTAVKNRIARSLSFGQQRRLALARLCLQSRRIWLCDEPLTGLDQDSQHLFSAQLAEHLANGGLAIITSHQPFYIDRMQKIRLAHAE